MAVAVLLLAARGCPWLPPGATGEPATPGACIMSPDDNKQSEIGIYINVYIHIYVYNHIYIYVYVSVTIFITSITIII